MGRSDRAVVVVGASAAGLRCACRLARLKPGWHVGVVEASPVFSYAACGLPYVLSGDITDPEICLEACRGVDVVFHQAALRSVPRSVKDPERSHAVNAMGALSVLLADKESGAW